jgi:hypothetical protein
VKTIDSKNGGHGAKSAFAHPTDFIAENDGLTRVELEHRRLDRFGDRRDQMREVFDKTGDWGQLLA